MNIQSTRQLWHWKQSYVCVDIILYLLVFLFGQASCTLEAGVKIYSLRVDSVHATAYKVLAGINRAGLEDEQGYNYYPLINPTIFSTLLYLFIFFYRNLPCRLVCGQGLCGLIFFLNCIASYLIQIDVWYVINVWTLNSCSLHSAIHLLSIFLQFILY